MKIKNLDRIKEIIKSKLSEYLQSLDLIIDNNKVQCPHAEAHKNADKGKLSAAFLPKTNNSLLWCFVEERKFDIFDVYSIREKRDITGQNFLEAVKTLAKRFGIPLDTTESFSLKERAEDKKREVIGEVHKLSLKNIKYGTAFYKERGLGRQKVEFFRIGFLAPDLITKELNDKFKSLFDYSLKGVLTHPALVIPVLTDNQQYAALIFRQFGCEPNDNYLNFSIEGKNLFNVNNLRGNDHLYIVEGVFDAIALYPNTNVVAALTNSLHDKDLECLVKKQFKKISIALDEDNWKQGSKRDGILKTILKLKNVDTDIEIVKLPEAADPDSFIQENNLGAFKTLETVTALQYLIENFQEKLIKIEEIYKFISSCPSIVKREALTQELCTKLSLGKRAVVKAIDSIEDTKDNINLLAYAEEKECYSDMLEDFTESAWGRKFRGIKTGFTMFDTNIGGFETTLYLYIGLPEMGKSLTRGTPVLMYDGSIKEVQNIIPKDKVMGDKSQPVEVTSIHSGKETMYNISPNKGPAWGCNESHILVLALKGANYSEKIFEITVKDFLNKSPCFQERCKLIRVGVNFPHKDTTYDPYFIGQWLGDGTAIRAQITQNEPELLSYYKNFAESVNLKFKHPKHGSKCPSYNFVGSQGKPNILSQYLRTLIVEGQKRIPKEYLINSREVRLKLLAGLIDSDGYLLNNCWEIVTKYSGLCEDILYLCRSLGFLANEGKLKCVKGVNYHRLFITGDIDCVPNKLARRKATTRISRKNHQRVGFKVLSEGIGTYYGFTLDKKSNGRFLLGDFTVTHNTSFLLNFVYQLIQSEDIFAAFYSLDDGAQRAIIPRLMSMVSGLSSHDIRDPSPDIKEHWERAMKKLSAMQDRLVIKDGSHIRTVADLDKYVNLHYNIAQEKDKRFVIIIDNLHALSSNSKYEANENTQRVAAYLKRIPQTLNCPIIATAEVPKSAREIPGGKDIKESIDIWYAARFVGGVMSAAHTKGGSSHLVWKPVDGNPEGKYMPIIQLYVSKNQTGKLWHGNLYYKLNWTNNRLTECSSEETSLLNDGQSILT